MSQEKKPRSRVATVASYSSAELEFWRKIATERHVLRFKPDERGRVTNYRQRLYALRTALSREPTGRNALDMTNADLLALASRALLRIVPEFKGSEIIAYLLVGEPADFKALPELEAAGFKPIEAPDLGKL